jgi:ABC-2 type transport system ATP-binding protein
LRSAGVRVEDLEIGRADLEDVFLDIMQGRSTSLAPQAPVASAAEVA